MVKLIVFDLDGTFLNSEHHYDTKVLSLIEALKEQKYLFGIATGRPFFAVTSLFDNIFKYFDFVVTNNGSEYFTEDNYHSISKLTMNQVMDVVEIAGEYKSNIISVNEDKFVIDFPTNYTGQLSTIGSVIVGDHDYTGTYNHPKIMIHDDEAILDKIQYSLSHSEQSFDFVKSQHDLLEFVPKGVDKMSTIKTYIKDNINEEIHITTFGDNHNDFNLINEADIGIAMNNAVPEIKKIADLTISSNDEDSIIHYLSSLLTE